MYQKMFSSPAPIMTRPSNQTPYSINDSISDNATAGSVTAMPADVADAPEQPICIEEVMVDTNDTALAAACQIRVYVFRGDPTASSGVVNGDNAAYSNKRNHFVGSFIGQFQAFSDGGRAICVPEQGAYRIVKPGDGNGKLWVQFQALTAFTPSANSTTLQASLKGFLGRG